MTDQPIDEVVNCEIHEAYRVEFAAIEDVDWASYAAPDADNALQVWLGKDTEAGDTELLNLLKYESRSSFADQVIFAGLFGDGTTHASITASKQPGGDVWAVTHAVVCTLEEVPPEEAEEEDEFGYLEDDDLFEE
ncbi:hypothetical protein GCM10009547_23250 [Sporichthya brevicatena]|uniref:Uncharacterized protein n=1 Tax=Sporichthya brevicatena TaxID=171442 RepID=A0ABN1GUQ7_9ACTN